MTNEINERQLLYTDDQLLRMAHNFSKVHYSLLEVFIKISNRQEGIALHEISQAAKVSAFVRDKCIAALELPELIKKTGMGTERVCKLTAEGKRLRELLKIRG